MAPVSSMPLLLDLLYSLGIALSSPWLLWRRLRAGATSGSAGEQANADWPEGGVWLHGASVGEVTLLKPLVARLEVDRPELPLVISSGTVTGVAAARRAHPRQTCLRMPFDFSWRQTRLMRALRPRLIVVVESDLWPNHLLAAERAGVPVAIVNAKLSERSLKLHRLSGIVPRALRQVALVAAQTDRHADRFAALGVPRDRITVTGNMKYDLMADPGDVTLRARLRRRLGFADEDVVVIGGSLHRREDVDLLAAFRTLAGLARPVRLIIVPRYPDQASAVAENVRAAGLQPVAKSVLDMHPDVTLDGRPVVVGDTIGELRELYAAADIAFVGGSLYFRGSNKGGHNLMEPAILGLPVLFGPHHFSFRETVADLVAAEAGIEVSDRDELGAALRELVASDTRRAAVGARARRVVLEGRGAAARNFELLAGLLAGEQSCSVSGDTAQCRHQTHGKLLNE